MINGKFFFWLQNVSTMVWRDAEQSCQMLDMLPSPIRIKGGTPPDFSTSLEPLRSLGSDFDIR